MVEEHGDLELDSVFLKKSISQFHQDIQTVYLQDSRPWVLGYSGGKDSTCVLQLVWNALSQLPVEKRTKPLYIITSDTYVENPAIVDQITDSIEHMNEEAKKADLPFTAQKVFPKLKDTFWVNLIGRGYPAPNRSFRWCTDRLKIRPANDFILERVAQHGEVVLILGVRKAESMTRKQVMSLHRIEGTVLSKHSKLPQVYVYTPIEDFTLEDVWTYLHYYKNPWGMDNHDLWELYRSSRGGECPLVIDKTTPSCGNSRFGCWTCTVVARDLTMEGLIDGGEDWLQPLLELRDYLAKTQEPERKRKYRQHKRRNGRTRVKKAHLLEDTDDIFVRGPYRFKYRKKILRKVLEAQKSLREHGPDPEITLIMPEELYEIRRLWRTECSDWEDSVPAIYREVIGDGLDWPCDELDSFGPEEIEMLVAICEQYDVPPQLVTRLLDIERRVYGMKYRASIFVELERALSEEWRTEAEILDEMDSISPGESI